MCHRGDLEMRHWGRSCTPYGVDTKELFLSLSSHFRFRGYESVSLSLSLSIYIYYMFQGMKWERRGFIGEFELALYQWISSSIHNEYVYVFILLDLITHHKASSQITFNNLIIYNLPAALFNEIISTAIQHKLCSLIFKIQVTCKKIIYGSSFFTS